MDVLFSVELETCATFDRGACAIIDKKKFGFPSTWALAIFYYIHII